MSPGALQSLPDKVVSKRRPPPFFPFKNCYSHKLLLLKEQGRSYGAQVELGESLQGLECEDTGTCASGRQDGHPCHGAHAELRDPEDLVTGCLCVPSPVAGTAFGTVLLKVCSGIILVLTQRLKKEEATASKSSPNGECLVTRKSWAEGPCELSRSLFPLLASEDCL